MRSDLRYVLVLCGTMLLAALPVVALNYRIGEIGWANLATATAAWRWQTAERGVAAVADPQDHNFKVLMLKDRLPEIDSVVLGASTAQSIRSDHLAPLRAYNFATSANVTASVVAEADYLVANAPAVKWLVVPLDWVLGYIYRDEAPTPAGSIMAAKIIPLKSQLRDTLTLRRVSALAKMAGEWARAADPQTAIGVALSSAFGQPYSCPDGALARDFAAEFPRKCSGFRWDGSNTFGALPPLSEERYRVSMRWSLQRDSEYVQAVISHRGIPNAVYLERIAVIAAELRSRGGGVIALLPPLMPGLEQELMRSDLTGDYVRHTKEVIDRWARASGIAVIDAGASENFGCEPREFIDGHHNVGTCYGKVFASFWRNGHKSATMQR